MGAKRGQAARRRALLASAGAVAAAGAAAALLRGDRAVRTLLRSVAPAPSLASRSDWRQLGERLHGKLLLPGAPGYRVAHELFDPRFDRVRPRAVARCASSSDVQRCIDFARIHGLPLAVRSGGHSYAGYSTGTGLVVDVRGLRQVAFRSGAAVATVGAGTLQVDLYAGLARYGRCVPGASCATVGIGGLALGGGVGVLARQLGLTCDNVAGLELVTADGVLRRCDTATNPDLYWACRGGGGGNFGAVTSFVLRAHPAPTVSAFGLQWAWSAAPEVVPAWIAWAPHAPDALWSNCSLIGTLPGSPPQLRVAGVYIGEARALGSLLDAFVRLAGTPPATRSVAAYPFLDAMLMEAGCQGFSVAQCHLPAQNGQGRLSRVSFAAKSDFLSQPLGPHGVATLLDGVAARGGHYRLPGGAVLLDASGGAVNRVPADATAYVHRNDLCSLQYYAAWPTDADSAVQRANRAWLSAFHRAMRPFVSGYAYQNYIDPQLRDWQHAYYGANLPRLVAVKRRYDPDDFFHFAQSIPTRLPAGA